MMPLPLNMPHCQPFVVQKEVQNILTSSKKQKNPNPQQTTKKATTSFSTTQQQQRVQSSLVTNALISLPEVNMSTRPQPKAQFQNCIKKTTNLSFEEFYNDYYPLGGVLQIKPRPGDMWFRWCNPKHQKSKSNLSNPMLWETMENNNNNNNNNARPPHDILLLARPCSDPRSWADMAYILAKTLSDDGEVLSSLGGGTSFQDEHDYTMHHIPAAIRTQSRGILNYVVYHPKGYPVFNTLHVAGDELQKLPPQHNMSLKKWRVNQFMRHIRDTTEFAEMDLAKQIHGMAMACHPLYYNTPLLNWFFYLTHCNAVRAGFTSVIHYLASTLSYNTISKQRPSIVLRNAVNYGVWNAQTGLFNFCDDKYKHYLNDALFLIEENLVDDNSGCVLQIPGLSVVEITNHINIKNLKNSTYPPSTTHKVVRPCNNTGGDGKQQKILQTQQVVVKAKL